MAASSPIILGIESSCDDTSAAVSLGKKILSNVISSQKIHEQYGGVVPELASRAHQSNIVPVVHAALQDAGMSVSDLDAIACTFGPGLLGSLLVGASFGKSLSQSLDIPLIDVHHMKAHVLAHLIDDGNPVPEFPFLCLTVSGGHTQIVLVQSPYDMEVIGETLDDAVGEAFDKTAKMLGLPYPGGPLIDKLAQDGNENAFAFSIPKIEGLNYSFSGIKTQVLYFLRQQKELDDRFIEKRMNDIAASVQKVLIDFLVQKLVRASRETGINEIAIAGGVSANSALRKQLREDANKHGWNIYVPDFQYCTDNAGMIAIAGYFDFKRNRNAGLSLAPRARFK